MEELLKEFKGKKIDVNCGSNVAYRGEVAGVEGGVLRLANEDGEIVYIAVGNIAAVAECKDHISRPGFIV